MRQWTWTFFATTLYMYYKALHPTYCTTRRSYITNKKYRPEAKRQNNACNLRTKRREGRTEEWRGDLRREDCVGHELLRNNFTNQTPIVNKFIEIQTWYCDRLSMLCTGDERRQLRRRSARRLLHQRPVPRRSTLGPRAVSSQPINQLLLIKTRYRKANRRSYSVWRCQPNTAINNSKFSIVKMCVKRRDLHETQFETRSTTMILWYQILFISCSKLLMPHEIIW